MCSAVEDKILPTMISPTVGANTTTRKIATNTKTRVRDHTSIWQEPPSQGAHSCTKSTRLHTVRSPLYMLEYRMQTMPIRLQV